jgi:hypothetical protein
VQSIESEKKTKLLMGFSSYKDKSYMEAPAPSFDLNKIESPDSLYETYMKRYNCSIYFGLLWSFGLCSFEIALPFAIG